MMRKMLCDGASVHGHDFKRLTLKLKVEIAIRGSIHNAPKLALTRSDFNLRPHETVQREDLIWFLGLRTTGIRAKVNAMFQISRVRIVDDGTTMRNHDALRQAS